MASFHISELARTSRDYMIRAAKAGAIELVLIPIKSNLFTNCVKDLCIRAPETFAREPFAQRSCPPGFCNSLRIY